MFSRFFFLCLLVATTPLAFGQDKDAFATAETEDPRAKVKEDTPKAKAPKVEIPEAEAPAQKVTAKATAGGSSRALFATAAATIRGSAVEHSPALQSALETYASKIHLGHRNSYGRAMIYLSDDEKKQFLEIIAGHQEVVGKAEAAEAQEVHDATERYIEHQRELQKIRAQPRPIVVNRFQRNFGGNRNYGGGWNQNNFRNPQLQWIRQQQESYRNMLRRGSDDYQRVLGLR